MGLTSPPAQYKPSASTLIYEKSFFLTPNLALSFNFEHMNKRHELDTCEILFILGLAVYFSQTVSIFQPLKEKKSSSVSLSFLWNDKFCMKAKNILSAVKKCLLWSSEEYLNKKKCLYWICKYSSNTYNFYSRCQHINLYLIQNEWDQTNIVVFAWHACLCKFTYIRYTCFDSVLINIFRSLCGFWEGTKSKE